MQSASLSDRLNLAQERIVGGARSSLSGGAVWSAALVFLLTFAIARSTATQAWVPGLAIIPLIALGGAVLVGLLAVLPVPWPVGLAVGMLVGPVVAAFGAAPAIHAVHPTDVLGLRLIGVWWGRIADGSATNDQSAYLFLICWLMWVTGAWLSWCVLRWRKPLLGLIPGAAAFATNLLNEFVPGDQNGYTLAILVLTLALLLWTNYTASIESATRAQVKMTGDARWDFWESGLVAMAALIVLAIMLPPLSTVDRTTQMESSLFTNWAQLQQQLNHSTVAGVGLGGAGFTGFVTDVPLGQSLVRTKDPVFVYTKVGDFSTPVYFRGVNETLTAGGEWRYPNTTGFIERLAKNQSPQLAETYEELAFAQVDVKMLRPPVGNADILFYPGQDYRVDRPTVASEVILPRSSTTGSMTTVDRLSSASPATSIGNYNVRVQYSIATEDELRGAGANYPDWLQPFSGLPDTGYRSPEVLKKIRNLALDIVNSAGATNPYDAAMAIQSYLRDPNRYTYTLTPPQAPPGVDRLDYFLFTSKQGYCEFFASAMGDMLRLLGIPTRLVNGFGPGTFDSTINSFVVRGEDAHTWVELYFPGYGWIPFEPTADNTYFPITRGTQGQTVCLRDNCDVLGGTGPIGAGAVPTPSGLPRGFRDPNNPGGGTTGFRLHAPDAGTLTTIVGLVVAVLLIVFAAVARYLRPRSVMGVWKRTLRLSEMAGAKPRPGETPLELGRRLQQSFPEASDPVGALADGFVVAAYAPPDLAAAARSTVMEAWTALRPLLVRRVLARLRPNRI